MYNDKDIKIEHSPETTYSLFNINQVGTDVLHKLPAAPATVTTDNSILFTGAETLATAISSTTEAKPYVLVTQAGTYYEALAGMDASNLEGVYASGSLDVYLCFRTLDYTPANSNSIFVAKTGDDTTGDGSMETPYLTLAKAASSCDATHQIIVILDSGKYEEPGLHFSGNVKGLYAAEGQTPTYSPTMNSGIVDYSEGEIVAGPTALADSSFNYPAHINMGDHFIRFYYSSSPSSMIKYDTVDTYTGVDITTGNTLISGSYYPHVAKLASGNIIIVYTIGTTMYYRIYSPAMVELTGQTQLDTDVDGLTIRVKILNNDNILIVYAHTHAHLHFKIMQEDGTVVMTSDHLATEVIYIRDVGVLAGGNFAIAWEHYIGGNLYMYIAMYDQDGTQVVAPTSLATSQWNARIVPLSNGNWFLIYVKVTAAKLYYRIYGPTGSEVKGETEAVASGILNDYIFGAMVLPTNDILFMYSSSDNYDYYLIYDEDGNQVKNKTQLSHSGPVAGALVTPIFLLDNDNIVYYGYDRDNSNAESQFIFQPYTYPGLKVSVDATIHGVDLDADDHDLLNRLILLDSANLTIKFSRLANVNNSAGNGDILGYAINGTGDVTVQNCLIESCGGGISITSNASTITDTQIYRCDDDYAISIDGAAAALGDITIKHCDLFDNYGGIHLENNDGTNEVIKNNIIHNNANYGIDAETEVTYSHTVTTDTMTGTAEGSSVFHANPAYVNEGTADPDDLDLNIKTLMTGYQIDSPAKGLADDDRNAGAIDVQYLTAATTWTAITLEKPKQIDRWLEPVGEVKTERKDGSVRTSKEALTEYLSLEYDGILNADYAKVLGLYNSSSSQVRIYEDPTTYANDYAIWRLVYNKIGKGAKHYRLTRTGVQGVTLTFARAWEPEE